MLTEHTVAAAGRAAGLEGLVEFRPVTGSTNTDVIALAEAGAPAWTTVVAGHQGAGRGRLGRTWLSEPGASLLVSVLIRPRMDPADAPLLTLATAVAAAAACSTCCRLDVRCKWPNDLVSNGRKIGGILTEGKVVDGRLSHIVIGLGLNVRHGMRDLPPELRDEATSMAIEGGELAEEALLVEYLVRLRQLHELPPGDFAAFVLRAYRERCETIGRRVRARTTAGHLVEGTATALGPAGELLVEGPRGLESVAFGEVQHLR